MDAEREKEKDARFFFVCVIRNLFPNAWVKSCIYLVASTSRVSTVSLTFVNFKSPHSYLFLLSASLQESCCVGW